MINFFDDDPVELDRYRAQPAPYSQPRSLTGAAQRLKLTDNARERVDKRKVSAWQTAAWQFFDQIGEVKFAFSLIGQVISRVRLYTAFVDDPDSPPVNVSEFLQRFDDKDATSHKTRHAMEQASEVVEDLSQNAFNSLSSLLREAAINLSVPGEFYLMNHGGKWHIVSSDELVASGNSYKLRRDRTSSAAQDEVNEKTFIARIWRAHPRFSNEPDSSMLGVLDQCEQLVLLDQAMRVLTRSRLNAGALFVPDGVGAAQLEQELAQAATNPLEDESAMTTVVPLILRGPAELGREIKMVDLSRRVDADMLEQQTRALDRVLAGMDIPKDIVQGLSNARYSNAIIITDEMFRSHVEPLVLLIVDALTNVVLQPKLKQLGIDPEIAASMVIWYDPSDIVTRPDRSQAANDGFDRKILSAKAWRSSRGFTELDAPDEEELIARLAIERAQIPPEMASPMLETLNPEFFAEVRQQGQAASEMPTDISQMLSPQQPGAAPKEDIEGGDVAQGGFMPPPAG